MTHVSARLTRVRCFPLLAVISALLLLVGDVASAATPGAELWAKRFGIPSDATAQSIGVNPDGSAVYITGYANGSRSGYDYVTLAYDSVTGAQLWLKRYDGPAGSYDVAYALGVSPDGSTVYVTGTSRGLTSDLDYATIAYDASTGERLWARRSNGAGNSFDYAFALAVSPDGSAVFVTGRGEGATSGPDYVTIAYEAATGARLWTKTYDGPGHDTDVPSAIRVSPDGSMVVVTGQSYSATSGIDFATFAYDTATGSKLWFRRFNGPSNGLDTPTALMISPDGSKVYVTGASGLDLSATFDYSTVAYDASNGTQLWAKRHDGSANDHDWAYGLGVSPDGSTVFVTGFTTGPFNYKDYTTIAYSAADGSRLWLRRYDGSGNADFAYALGVSPDGSKVFVAGGSIGSNTAADYTTLAYDAASGARLWASRYNGPANGLDYATVLAVSPDGSEVFVSGQSDGTRNNDYATIAYSAA
jgi:DNA-binding beta-propeller fold protein YncE